MKPGAAILVLFLLTFATPSRGEGRYHAEPGAVSPQTIAGLSATSEETRQRIVAFLDDPAPPTTIDYHIYPSFEAKGMATGNTQLRHADPEENRVHLVITDWIRGDDALMDARIILRERLGMPATHMLDIGLAMYFTQDWRERGFEYWAARLFASGNMLPLADLLDNETLTRQSYLVTSPLAASFIAFIVDSFGKRVLLDNYIEWRPSGAEEVERLQKGWHLYLEEVAGRHRERIDADRRAFPTTADFRKGFCHAHEGYRIYNGYLSDASDRALSKLSDLGTNAISITPFTYLRDPHRPAPLPFSHHSGAENDESVIHASNTAHQLGMTVMLKPHIWLGRSWPGDIEMRTPEDWERFFEYYLRWIRHYALLAEMYRIESLCIGVELVKTTLGHDEAWRRIVASIRQLYSGDITYAANWGEEFENIRFWDVLDYIGVNCYYPLAGSDSADPAMLAAGARRMFDRMKTVHERFDKPVIITEIGYTATNSPWKQPYEPVRRSGRAVNVEHQAMCYRAVFEALYGEDWCAGIYWWKWPSFLEYGGMQNPDFTPNGKPAERVVGEWYRRAW